MFHIPPNDGTNACVFLCLKVCHAVGRQKKITYAEGLSMIEEAMKNFLSILTTSAIKNNVMKLKKLVCSWRKMEFSVALDWKRKVPTRDFIQKKEILSCTKFFKKKGFSFSQHHLTVWLSGIMMMRFG